METEKIDITKLLLDADKKDYPEKYHEIINVVGKEEFVRLMQKYGGTAIYIPTPQKAVYKILCEKIKDYETCDYKELTNIFGVSASTIYRMRKNPDNKEKSF